MTEVQTWSTDPIPQAARFTAWADQVQALHLDWELSSPKLDDYAARIRYHRTGNARLAEVSCEAFQGRRNPAPENPAIVGVQLQVSGHLTCTYGGNRFTLQPGDLFVWDSLQPGTFESDGQHRQLSLLVPASRVPKSLAATHGASRPLAAHPGAGILSLVADQFSCLIREMEQLNDDAVNRTVTSLLDLLDAAIAPVADADAGQRSELLDDIQQYILDRLDDRQLTVSSIAAAHWISVRTLHLVFSESGTSVARWVRRQRLERSRRELSNATESTTVTDVAFRWGFSDASHFSRAFKQEFGVSPTAVMPR